MSLNFKTVVEAKDFAKTLRGLLADKAGQKLALGHSLEVVAGLSGYANWDTLHGVLKTMQAPKLEYKMQRPRTLYLEAYCTDDWFDSPSWVRIEITPEFLQSLHAFCHEARSRGCSEMRRWEEVDELDETGDAHDLSNGELVVTASGMFWYAWSLSHSNGHVETRGLMFDELVTLLKQSDEQGSSVIVYAADVDSFKQQLDGDNVVGFCGECGSHYDLGGDGYDGKCPSCADAEFVNDE